MDFGASFDYGGSGFDNGFTSQQPYYHNPYLTDDYNFGSQGLQQQKPSFWDRMQTQQSGAQVVAKGGKQKFYTPEQGSQVINPTYDVLAQMQAPQPQSFDTFLRFLQQVGPLMYGGGYGSR